ncbi:MAG: glycosyltransferase family 39 protein [Saprospiraceae bacterium]
MKKADPNYTFCLITLVLFLAIFGFGIFSDGMFFDGIFYAAVSNNYAHHIGTFWAMQYSPTLLPPFNDQPPLALFLQAMFFKMLGDSIYVERFYCFLFTLLNIYIIKKIWSLVSDKAGDFFWLPILIWILIPLTGWTFQNNLMEVTMSAFDLLAIYYIIKGCKTNSFFQFFLGGIFICCAGLSKGFQGLFPIISPLLYWWVYRETRFTKAILQFLSMLLIPVLFIAFLYIYPVSHHSLQLYLEDRIAGTFNHGQDTTTTRFFLLYKLLLQLSIPVSLIAIIWLFVRKNIIEKTPVDKTVYFFLLVGLSASLPLMVTLEQREFYLTTSLPYFALSIGLISIPIIKPALKMLSTMNLHHKLINNVLMSLILVLIITIAFTASKPKREGDLIADLSIIHKVIPEYMSISIPSELNSNWTYHAYFMRYCKLSLDDKNKQKYFLNEIEMNAPTDSCYQNMDLRLKRFNLFECRSK